MTDSPHGVIRFPKKNIRLVKEDCQGEGFLMSALEGSVQMLSPGIDLSMLRAKQDQERLVRRAKEAWTNWCEATDAVLAIKDIPGDPTEQMLQYIDEVKGKSHE